jgi:hypothetical protein
MNFSGHDGEQKQGIKRLVDQIESLQSLCIEHKDTLYKLKCVIDILDKDYVARQDYRNKLLGYVSTVAKFLLHYTMIPLVIFFLIFMGISPEFIPWYNHKASTDINNKAVEDFNRAGVSLIMLTDKNKINESDVINWCQKYVQLSVVSYLPDINSAIKDNHNVSGKHFFVWIPKGTAGGFVQMYGENGRKIGCAIEIIRGK